MTLLEDGYARYNLLQSSYEEGEVNYGNDIDAGEGDDIVVGGTHSDTIKLGEGNDIAFGGGGHDDIQGGDGDDHIYGDRMAPAMTCIQWKTPPIR